VICHREKARQKRCPHVPFSLRFHGCAGIFRSKTDGDDWNDISSVLIAVGGNVWAVAIDPGGYTLAGTARGGVFRSVETTTNRCPRPERYWKNNPAFWPVNSLKLGSQSYAKTELQKKLKHSEATVDASLVLAGQLIAVKLNLANGSEPVPVRGTINDADALSSRFPGKLPCKVKRSSPLGQAIANDATVLTDYNLGNLTPDCTP